jgi:hypothetical protein
MKLFLLVCSFLIVLACSKIPQREANSVSLVSASYSISYPGIVPANTTHTSKTRYAVEVKVSSATALSFNALITNGKSMPIEVLKNGTRNSQGPYAQGDVLTLIAWSTNATDATAQQGALLGTKDVVGVVEYSVNGNVMALPVKEFKKTNPDRVNQ